MGRGLNRMKGLARKTLVIQAGKKTMVYTERKKQAITFSYGFSKSIQGAGGFQDYR